MAAPYNTTGYTGKTYDAKAGLMDYSARWYSPNNGRFITEDTFLGWMNEPLSLNRYTYVLNNPVNFIDPTGNEPIDDDIGNEPTYVRDVGLYVDDIDNGTVELWSNGTTYFHDGRAVRPFYESQGYTVRWDNELGVLVYSPYVGGGGDDDDDDDGGQDPGGGDDGDSEPTLEEQIADRDNEFAK